MSEGQNGFYNSPPGSKARKWTFGHTGSRHLPAPGISNWQIDFLGSSFRRTVSLSGRNNAGSCWRMGMPGDNKDNKGGKGALCEEEGKCKDEKVLKVYTGMDDVKETKDARGEL